MVQRIIEGARALQADIDAAGMGRPGPYRLTDAGAEACRLRERIGALEAELAARPEWRDVTLWRAVYHVMEYGREYTLGEIAESLRGIGVDADRAAIRMALWRRMPDVFEYRCPRGVYVWRLA